MEARRDDDEAFEPHADGDEDAHAEDDGGILVRIALLQKTWGLTTLQKIMVQ